MCHTYQFHSCSASILKLLIFFMFTQYFLVEYQAYVTNLTLVIEVITISL